MKDKLTVVKIGGNIINDEKELDKFLFLFSKMRGLKILIHGGGKVATSISDRLGIKSQIVEGRRVTGDKDLEIVTMVYAGLINKKICAKLQYNKNNAIGLSGADANSIRAKKREIKKIDYGWVGDIEEINTKMITMFLANNLTPVFSSICHNGAGQLLNTNADTIASEVAISMSEKYEVELLYCFEKKGVLENIKDENSIIQKINLSKYKKLKSQGIINEGMIPKLENCFFALKNKVEKVSIGNIEMIENNKKLHTMLML